MREDHRKTIEELIERLGSGRWTEPDYLLGNMAEDCEWWVAGSMPLSGTMTRQQLMDMFRGVDQMAEGGLKITPKSWIVDGDRVALEAESFMKLRNGRTYNNQYHFAFRLENGKIKSVREYMDTQHAAEVLS